MHKLLGHLGPLFHPAPTDFLAVGEYAAGYHSVVWNATDNASNKVPSGIYFYRIQAGDFIKTTKMVLLK